jgi:hypothetical protein
MKLTFHIRPHLLVALRDYLHSLPVNDSGNNTSSRFHSHTKKGGELPLYTPTLSQGLRVPHSIWKLLIVLKIH